MFTIHRTFYRQCGGCNLTTFNLTYDEVLSKWLKECSYLHIHHGYTRYQMLEHLIDKWTGLGGGWYNYKIEQQPDYLGQYI